jgi:hypothetical protein
MNVLKTMAIQHSGKYKYLINKKQWKIIIFALTWLSIVEGFFVFIALNF